MAWMPWSLWPSLSLKSNSWRCPPEIVGLLGIRVADFPGVLEAGAGDPQVGKLHERLTREQILVGLRGLHRVAVRRVVVDEFLELAVGELVEAGFLRVLTIGRERDRLRQIDRGAGRAAAAPAAGSAARSGRAGFGRLGARVAAADLVLRAGAAGQVAAGRSIERQLPQIEPVLDDDRLLVGAVAGDAVGGLRTRVIELEIDEARGRGAAERARGRGVEVVRVEPVVLPIEEILAVGRNAEGVAAGRSVDQLVLQHQRALAGRGVDAVDVGGGPLVVVDEAAR